MLIGYLQIFFEQMSTHILCSILICLFFVVEFRSSLTILDIKPLSDTWFANMVAHPVGCAFTLLIMTFEAQNFLISMKSSICIFLFYWLLLGCQNHEIITKSYLVKFCLMFPSKGIIVLALTLRYLIHWESSYVYSVR